MVDEEKISRDLAKTAELMDKLVDISINCQQQTRRDALLSQ
jgi:hypothetical protein